jgi:hypothetical protein
MVTTISTSKFVAQLAADYQTALDYQDELWEEVGGLLRDIQTASDKIHKGRNGPIYPMYNALEDLNAGIQEFASVRSAVIKDDTNALLDIASGIFGIAFVMVAMPIVISEAAIRSARGEDTSSFPVSDRIFGVNNNKVESSGSGTNDETRVQSKTSLNIDELRENLVSDIERLQEKITRIKSMLVERQLSAQGIDNTDYARCIGMLEEMEAFFDQILKSRHNTGNDSLQKKVTEINSKLAADQLSAQEIAPFIKLEEHLRGLLGYIRDMDNNLEYILQGNQEIQELLRISEELHEFLTGPGGAFSQQILGQLDPNKAVSGAIRIAVLGMAIHTCEQLDIYARKCGLNSIDDILEALQGSPILLRVLTNILNGHPTRDDLNRLTTYVAKIDPAITPPPALAAIKEFVNDYLSVNTGIYYQWADRIEQFSSLFNVFIEPENPGHIQNFKNLVGAPKGANIPEPSLEELWPEHRPTVDVASIVYSDNGGLLERLKKAKAVTDQAAIKLGEDLSATANDIIQRVHIVHDSESMLIGLRNELRIASKRIDRYQRYTEEDAQDITIHFDYERSASVQLWLGRLLAPAALDVITTGGIATSGDMVKFFLRNNFATTQLAYIFTNTEGLRYALETNRKYWERVGDYAGDIKDDIDEHTKRISDAEDALKKLNSQKSMLYRQAIVDVGFKQAVVEYALLFADHLDTVAKKAGLKSVDEFLGNIGSTTPVGRALYHLAHGYPDSNDICTILEYGNELTLNADSSKGDRTIKYLVEEKIKRDPNAYFAVASRIDEMKIIPKAKHVDDPNDMFRAEYTEHTAPHSLQIIAYNDIRIPNNNIPNPGYRFNLTLTRHGGLHDISDQRIHFGGPNDINADLVPKLVQTMTPEELRQYAVKCANLIDNNQGIMPTPSVLFVQHCVNEYIMGRWPSMTNTQFNSIDRVPEFPIVTLMINDICELFMGNLRANHIPADDNGMLGNIIAQSFLDFFGKMGKTHYLKFNMQSIELQRSVRGISYKSELNEFRDLAQDDMSKRYGEFLEIMRKNVAAYKALSGSKELAAYQTLMQQIQADLPEDGLADAHTDIFISTLRSDTMKHSGEFRSNHAY